MHEHGLDRWDPMPRGFVRNVIHTVAAGVISMPDKRSTGGSRPGIGVSLYSPVTAFVGCARDDFTDDRQPAHARSR